MAFITDLSGFSCVGRFCHRKDDELIDIMVNYETTL